MKSIFKISLMAFCLSLFVISCKEHKHSEDTHTHDSPAIEKADLAMNEVYQCPMDCEKGKTYEEEGICPVCKMDLKKVKKTEKETDSDHKHDDGSHEGHNH